MRILCTLATVVVAATHEFDGAYNRLCRQNANLGRAIRPTFDFVSRLSDFTDHNFWIFITQKQWKRQKKFGQHEDIENHLTSHFTLRNQPINKGWESNH